MPSKGTPNAEQTVELMVETIRERILDRIDELDIEKGKVSRGKSRGYYKRIKNKDLYADLGKLEKQLKSLKRGLGGLLTSDPNAKLKSGETWGGFVRSLLDENVQGEELASRLGKFGAFVDQKKKLVPGKVGHHRTGLSVLREILKDKPFDFRTKFKSIAAFNGYNIGEEFVDFIDPAAHKEFTTNVAGELSKRFGWQKAQEIPESLVQALSERYAHAMQFGGTNPARSGFDIPIGYLKDGFDEETLFKFAKPYLEASKRGADAGLQIDDILTKTNWETPEDLIKNLDKVALNQTDDLLDIFGNKLGTKLSAAEKAARKVNPEVLEKMGLSLDNINPNLIPTELNKAVDTAEQLLEWRKIAAGSAVAGLSGISILGTGASAAETTARVKIAKQTGKPIDEIQAAISTFSLLNDAGSYTGAWAVPGAILSSGADASNIIIDSYRNPQTEAEKQIVKEKQDKTIEEQFGSTTYGML